METEKMPLVSPRRSLSESAGPPPKYRLILSMRLLVMTLVLLGNFFGNAGFLLFNFSIVCMVNSTAVAIPETTNNTEDVANHTTWWDRRRLELINLVIEHRLGDNRSITPETHSASGYNGDLLWSRNVQANVIAGFSWGMLSFTIPAGIIIQKTQSTKGVFLFGVIGSSISLLVTPVVAYLPSGEWYVFAARFLGGMAAGLGWPLMIAVATRWLPEREMGTMIAFAACGMSVAGLAVDPISGHFCSVSQHGWTYAFFLWGALNLILVVIIAVFFTNDPTESKFVSEAELADIMENRIVDISRKELKHASVPYCRMLLSFPFWAIIAANIAAGWTQYFQADYVPTYIKEVLQFDIQKNGFLTALPFLLEIVGLVSFGFLSDHVTSLPDEEVRNEEDDENPSKKIVCCRRLSPTTSVKMFEVVALGGAGLAFLTISFCDSTLAALAIVGFCVCTLCAAAEIVGYTRSMYLIAPDFVGIIAGIGETAQGISALVVPYAIASITNGGTIVGWQETMVWASVISFSAMFVFVAFGSGDLQSWARVT